MDQVIKKRWQEALRSGDYKQTTGALRRSDGFCCLGVLCDLAVRDGVTAWVQSRYGLGRFSCEDNDGVVPYVVANWCGMSPNPPVQFDDGGMYTLSAVNDFHDKTFAEIADLIDEL